MPEYVFSVHLKNNQGEKRRKKVLILLLVWLWIKQTLLQVSEVLVFDISEHAGRVKNLGCYLS